MFKNITTLIVSSFSCVISVGFFVALQLRLKKIKQFKQALKETQVSHNDYPLVSVLVPARNEEAVIIDCLNSILEQTYPNFEVLAIDDNSTDHTPQLLTVLAARYPQRMRIIQAVSPPPGWLGKQNALWQGYLQINPSAEWLLFVDADTELVPESLLASVNYAQRHQLDMFSLFEHTDTDSFWVSMLHTEILKFFTLASLNFRQLLPDDAVENSEAHGAYTLVRRAAYQAVDGHQAIKNLVMNDIRLARLFRTHGFVTFAEEGAEYVKSKPFDGLRDYWSSMSRNLFLRAGKSWIKMGAIIGFEFGHGLWPIWLAGRQLALNYRGKGNRFALLSSLTATVLIFSFQVQAKRSLHIAGRYAALYPCSVLLSTAIFLDSAYRTTFGKAVKWKGRDVNILQN